MRHVGRLGSVAGAMAFVGLALCMSGVRAQAVSPAVGQTVPFPIGQSKYYEACGGCHGLNGVSAREQIPVLRSQVGAFLCSEEGRKYIVQLPNVSFAAFDDATLAATMNYVVFKLGDESVPKGARPYTASEVGELRRHPLKNQPLMRLRTAVLGRAVSACSHDARMADSSPTQ